MTGRPREWSWGDDSVEIRIMALPDRKASYLVLVDDAGMRQVARFLDDHVAEEFAAWLDSAVAQS